MSVPVERSLPHHAILEDADPTSVPTTFLEHMNAKLSRFSCHDLIEAFEYTFKHTSKALAFSARIPGETPVSEVPRPSTKEQVLNIFLRELYLINSAKYMVNDHIPVDLDVVRTTEPTRYACVHHPIALADVVNELEKWRVSERIPSVFKARFDPLPRSRQKMQEITVDEDGNKTVVTSDTPCPWTEVDDLQFDVRVMERRKKDAGGFIPADTDEHVSSDVLTSLSGDDCVYARDL